MDSHSYGGYNTSGSSFLQELTVEDGSKDVYAGSQPSQQRPFPAYQDPSSTHYSTPSDVPSSSFYNGQYNVDAYYYSHPSFLQRGKFSESYPVGQTIPSQPNPQSLLTQRPVSEQSSMNPAWSEAQQLPQYHSDLYASQSTFHSCGDINRMLSASFPPGHLPPASESTQQPYHSSSNPYQTSSGLYCHGDIPTTAYSGLPQPQQQPPLHSMPLNGDPQMNPYSQDSRISHSIPCQQLPKSPAKRSSKPRLCSGVVAKSSSYPKPLVQEPTAALERFVNSQCPPKLTNISSNELPSVPQQQRSQTPLHPSQIFPSFDQASRTVPPVSESRCLPVVRQQIPSSSSLSAIRPTGSSLLRDKSSDLTTSSLQSNLPSVQLTTANPPPAPVSSIQSATAFSPNLDQVPEASPPPPNLKSPLPIQTPPASSNNDNFPPILPKETPETEVFEREKDKLVPEKTKKLKESVNSMEQSEGIAALDLETSELETEKSSHPQKRHRGRKRKLDLAEDNTDVESPLKLHSGTPPKKKRSSKATDSTNARKTVNPPAKRPRRKTMTSKSASKDDLGDNDKLESEVEDVSTLSEFLGPLEGGEDDEDTMAASAAPTDADEESVAATTITTEETAPEALLKPPRPAPRMRAAKPKKKKTLKSLMKKKRRGAYHYGDESDGSESDVESTGGKTNIRGTQASASSHSLHSQFVDDSSLEGSARRSGRRAADRKKYIVDFGLSDDGDGEGDSGDGSDNEASKNPKKPSDTDFVDVKVVEKILGRRISTRPIKKSVALTNFETLRGKPIAGEMAGTETSKESESQKTTECQKKKEVEVGDEEEEEEEQVEEFYLKYKGFSYMHCEWKALDEIADPRIGTKLKKFVAKNGTDPLPSYNADDDDGTTVLFNPDYVEVDRVLDIRIYDKVTGDIITDEVLNPDGTIKRPSQIQKKTNKRRGRPPKPNKEEDLEDATTPETAESEVQEEGSPAEDEQPATITYYLVKWRSLPYEDATWELSEDVDPTKVKEFMRIRNPPRNPPVIRDSNHRIIRPEPSEWRRITIDEVYRNDNRLREYQVEGVNWLSYCWYNKRNCILADEMGLGKTVQSIAFLLEVVKAGVHGPFLIIVPLSTVGNWQREFENWSDLNAIVYHGSAISRNMIQEYELFYHKKKAGSSIALSSSQYRHDVYKFNVLITTFEVLMSDIEFFSKMHWAVAIIDEAHRLKNKKCKLGEGLRYLDFDHRVLLTGTPLQNNVEELFGLLNFLDPQRFACAQTFLIEFGELKTERQVEDLKSLLKPMMLRRLKEDVEKSLAPKEETIIEVELTNLQKKYYRAIMERNFSFLCKGITGSNMPNLMNVMMELRKCCNHPFLIKGAEEAILAEQRVLAEADPSKPYNEEQQMFNALLNASGKLVLIHKLLPKLKAGGHKVLVFSQMIRVLDILEDYLVYQGFSFERIDGRIHGLMRQEAIDRFCNDKEKFVFLLCTKAGGLGINLTAADVVIIYDSDWNPQNDLQAQARCHRIGQQKMVKVYRLITRNTYEREMFDRASLKLGLDKAVLQTTGAHARQAQLSKKEVEELLKKGAYGALMDDDKAGDDFCEEDIDQILQSRSHVVQLERGEKNSTFSKATFSISDNRNDIALDDPDFWQKWAKKAGVEQVGLEYEELIMTTPRQRRQTNRYTAELNEQQSSNNLSHSQSGSRLQNGKNGGGAGSNAESSDGQSSSDESSGADDDGGDSRASGNAGVNAKSKNKKSKRNRRNDAEITDRVDLFRVEKCLFTWSWGRWAYALDNFPFKRIFTELEMQRTARCILGYALKVTPALNGAGDGRVRALIMEMVNSNDTNVLKTIPDIVQALKNSSNSELSWRNAIGGGTSVVARRGRRMGVKAGGLETDSPNAPSTPTTPTANMTFDVDTPKEDQEGTKREDDGSSDRNDFGITSDSFKRHLVRAGGRLLARVYTLYFLHTEIVGLEQADGLCDGSLDHTSFTQLAESLPPLKALDADVPAEWWDSCCDKCLLLGVFKHGWEKYGAVRDDPAFCFYRRIYGPDAPNIPIPSTIGSLKNAIPMVEGKAEPPATESDVKLEEMDEDEEKALIVAINEKDTPKTQTERKKEPSSIEEHSAISDADVELPQPIVLFPAVVDLNSRMRKLIAYFQRIRAQIELEALHSLRAEFTPTVAPQSYLDQRIIKWSRREEADFYRVVSSFGVEQVIRSPPHSPTSSRQPTGRVFIGYNWNNFKGLANLSKKSDQAITEYYNAFFTMCHQVCKEALPEGTPPPLSSQPTTTTYGSCAANEVIQVAPISEERASRTLSRIKLLNRIRNVILTHGCLEERLALCQRSSDLPEWWVPGQHDRELLEAVARKGRSIAHVRVKAAAAAPSSSSFGRAINIAARWARSSGRATRHGLSRTDLNILPDKRFSFSRVAALVRRQLMKNPSALQGVTPPIASVSTDASMTNALSVSEVEARASLAAAASVAARAVAAELEAKIDAANVSQNEETSKQEIETQEKSKEEQKLENGELDEAPSVVVPADSNPTSPNPTDTQSINSEHFKWSLQFATSLAVAWPKDRTIHNRLEMVCQCIETGHWPLPRRYLLNSVDELGHYHIPDSTGGGSRDASPAPPSSPDIATQKKTLTPTEVATLAALQAAGYTNFEQVLALQAAVAAGAHQSDVAGPSSVSSSVSVTRGRGGGRGSRGGRGRGRGSRGGAGMNIYSREDFASAASLAKNSTSPLPTRGRGSRGGQVLPSRGSAGSTRGRKRKIESTDTALALPPPDSPAWDVNVPLISLTSGSLIHGDKAPKRRHLEAWLKANPEYMPYSVEQEDQIIFKRVAQSRGQNTSAMEALAYRHYVSSMLSKMVNYNASIGASSSSSTQRPTPSASVPASTSIGTDMTDQQKQMMNLIAASMYSGNPAYTGLLASMIGYAQAGNQQTQRQRTVESEGPSSSSNDANPTAPSEPTALDQANSSSSLNAISSLSASSQMTTENLQSVLTVYQQAASLLNYLYNPSLYAQQFGAAASATVNPASSSSSSSVQNQMTNLLSIFASTPATRTQQQQAETSVPEVSALSPRPSSSRQDPQEMESNTLRTMTEESDVPAVNVDTAPSAAPVNGGDDGVVSSENNAGESDLDSLTPSGKEKITRWMCFCFTPNAGSRSPLTPSYNAPRHQPAQYNGPQRRYTAVSSPGCVTQYIYIKTKMLPKLLVLLFRPNALFLTALGLAKARAGRYDYESLRLSPNRHVVWHIS
ncbi:hypothetical protein Aperf_G00000019024 [Anoplocephala perfoliata]